MKISFIGGGKRVENCSKLFANRNEFTIGGFYCNPIKDCADIAIATNTCLFACIDDLCKASDVIFIATEDEMLPAVIQTLTKLHIHNKIIVSKAEGIYANDLDTGYDNTYIAFDSFAQFEQMTDAEIEDAYIAINGSGSKVGLFADALTNSGIKCSLLSKPELELFRVACHMMHFGIYAILNSGRKLCKIATNSSKFNVMPLIKNAIRNCGAQPGAPYSNGNIREVGEIADILSNNGIDSITTLYRAIAEVVVENTNLEKDVADDMLKAIRK